MLRLAETDGTNTVPGIEFGPAGGRGRGLIVGLDDG